MILELLIFNISFWLYIASQKGLFGRVWKACFPGDEVRRLGLELALFLFVEKFRSLAIENGKNPQKIVISREFSSPFFEIKIIKLATSKSRHNSAVATCSSTFVKKVQPT